MTAQRRWYQLRHIVAATGIPERTIRSLTASGTLPALQPDPGRSRYLYGAATFAWLEAKGVRVDWALLKSQTSQSSELGVDDDTLENEA